MLQILEHETKFNRHQLERGPSRANVTLLDKATQKIIVVEHQTGLKKYFTLWAQ